MSTAPSGRYLFQYIPGVGKIPVVQCPPCPTGPTGAQGIPGEATNTGATGPTGPNPTETHITAYSNINQTLSTSPTGILHQVVPYSTNITLTPPSTVFNITQTGIYKVLYSAQFIGTSGTGRIAIWLVKNGSPMTDTGTYTGFKNGDNGLITAEFIVSLSSGDALEIYGALTAGTAVIEYIGASGLIPGAPGIVTDIVKFA